MSRPLSWSARRLTCKRHGSCLLCDYIAAERASGERVVASNDNFTAVVPFWAVWPFEVMLVAHRHAGSLADLKPAEVAGLADIMRQVTYPLRQPV